MTPFTTNLKRLRKEKGATQDDLAQQLHVTRQTVSSWETGRCQPDIETLMALAEALDADVNELIYGTKPGEYPKFQRKYVIWTAVCTGIVLVFLILENVIYPILRRGIFDSKLVRQIYGFVMNFDSILPQIGMFAAGVLTMTFCAMIWRICLPRIGRVASLVFGIVILIPSVWIALDTLLYLIFPGYSDPFAMVLSVAVCHPVWRAIILYILPLLSGIFIFLGTNKSLEEDKRNRRSYFGSDLYRGIPEQEGWK